MPSHLLMRVAWQMKDDDPKNVLCINPCFRRQLDILDPTSGTDALQLCTDLATAIQGWSVPVNRTVTVKAYNLQGAKPNYPLASFTKGAGGFITGACPPQQAVCLSFFSGQNQPRKRGRLYVPANVATITAADVASATIPTALRTKIAGLVPIFANLGGTNVDWIVWSRVAQLAGRVDNWWVDESWDIIRSRKLKAAVRDTGTTSG